MGGGFVGVGSSSLSQRANGDDSPADTDAATSDTETATGTDNWPLFGLDAANTGYAPDRSGPVAGATELWHRQVADAVRSSPVVAGGTAYVGADDGTVYAASVEDGRFEWTYDTGAAVVGAPAVTDGTVYVGSADASVYALDAADGSERWVLDDDAFVGFRAAANSADGRLYLGRDDGDVYALDAADGSVEWTYSVGGLVRAGPAVGDGRVYVASDDGTIAAVNAADGTEAWTLETPALVRSSPTVADGRVFVGGDDGRLRALDAADGSEHWSVAFDAEVRASPAVGDGTVYATTLEGAVTARAVGDGSERWTVQRFGAPRSPALAGDRLYVGTGFRIAGLDPATGEAAWAVRTGSPVTTAAAVSDGRLVFGTLDGRINAFGPTPATATAARDTDADPTAGQPSSATGPTNTVTSTGQASGGPRTPTAGTANPTPTATDEGRRTSTSGTVNPARTVTGGGPRTSTPAAANPARTAASGPGGDDAAPGLEGAVPVGPGVLALATLGAGVVGGGYLWHRRDGEGPTGDGAATGDADGVATAGQDGSTAGHADDIATAGGDGADDGGFGTAGRSGDSGAGGVDLGDMSLTGVEPTVGADADVSVLSLASGERDGASTGESTGGSSPGDEGRRDPSLRVAGPSADWTADDWPVPDGVSGEDRADVAYADIERGEPLAAGGQATVYRATVDTGDGARELALRELRVDSDADEGTEAADLARRAETWAGLTGHDHVVDVVDWGTDPVPWLLTEYVGGGHLGRRAGTLAFPQAVWVAVGVTRAVRHAHRRGVAHFDLKPANVLFKRVPDAWDVPKVADWGLSRRLLTHSGTVEGFSPQYAAPEQVDDRFGDPDDRTDVYGLGAVLYALFTGRQPYPGKPASVVRRVTAERPPAPSDVADVPQAVDDIVLTAMAREKRDRYESVLYLRDDLIALVDGQ